MSPRPSTPGDLTLHRSSRRNAVLAVVVGVAAAGGIPLALAGCAWVQVIGAIWLGLCAHASGRPAASHQEEEGSRQEETGGEKGGPDSRLDGAGRHARADAGNHA